MDCTRDEFIGERRRSEQFKQFYIWIAHEAKLALNDVNDVKANSFVFALHAPSADIWDRAGCNPNDLRSDNCVMLASVHQAHYNELRYFFMIERRLVGRRFVDFHPEAAAPLYPNELERRFDTRRTGDRAGASDDLEALWPGRRRLPPILWSGILRCSHCGIELLRVRNLSREARRYFIVEHIYAASTRAHCACQSGQSPQICAQIEWIMQSGTT